MEIGILDRDPADVQGRRTRIRDGAPRRDAEGPRLRSAEAEGYFFIAWSASIMRCADSSMSMTRESMRATK